MYTLSHIEQPAFAPRYMAFLLALLMAGCSTETAPPTEGQGGFITRLGADTLAAEQFVSTASRMTATVMLRTPTTTLRTYEMELDSLDRIVRFAADISSPENGVLRQDVAVREGDVLIRTRQAAGEEPRVDTLAMPDNALPFIDMVHWPYERVLVRARATGADSLIQPLFAGSRVWDFVVHDLAADSMTLTHPFRGTMGVMVDADGHLQTLDAGATTRKLLVERKDFVDVQALAASFAERDTKGASFGPLSGRGETTADLGPATVSVDYGRPEQRGRALFGALVPYNVVWRTGANRATHLTTDRDLQIGSVDVPAGTYTLFSIPEADGGTLIISEQTGQGGTSYNEDRDLGRTAMSRTTVDEPVETFTIDVVQDRTGEGRLRLVWGTTAYEVPVRVQ